MDNCNNQSACETTVTVVDCKKPTPYCKTGLVVELMVPVNPGDIPMVDVWAIDLNDNSFDNCTDADDLIFSFSADTSDVGVTYICDSVGQVGVEIWVTDEAGNQDFCETTVTVQANMGQCDYDPDVKCGYAGGGKYPNNDGYRYSAQGCSGDCIPLQIFGIGFIIIGGLVMLLPACVYCQENSSGYSRARTSSSRRKQTKIGCDCCHITV